MKFNDFIITDIGFSNVNAAVINEKDITFKKLVTGTGSWEVSEIPGAKELKEPKQEILISKVEILDDKTVRCLATISNVGLTESYLVKEVGVYIESNGKETLYSISTAKDEIEIPLESEVGMYQINFNFYQKISTGDINIRVANEAYVSSEDFNEIKKEVVDARKAIQGKGYTTLKDRINDIYEGNEIMGRNASGTTNYEGDTLYGGGITSFEFDIHMFGNVEQMRMEGSICGLDVEDIVAEGNEKGVTPILLTQTETGFHVSANIDASIITVADRIKRPGNYDLDFWFVGTFASYATQAIQKLDTYIKQLNSALSSKFECGSVSITGKSDGWVFIPVTYSYSHKTIPIVVASHSSADVAQIPCTTRYQSVSGFEIGLYKSTAQTTFNWIAIEP